MNGRPFITYPAGFFVQHHPASSYLLSLLFGKRNYHGFVGQHDIGSWKTQMVKVFRAISRSITLNIDSDEYQINELSSLIERYCANVKKADSIDKINVLTIEALIKICFQLLGELPNNWDKKATSHSQAWILNTFRKVSYSQNLDQKVNLLISLTNDVDYSKRLPKRNILEAKLYDQLNNDKKEFIAWFKKEYTEVYLEIF